MSAVGLMLALVNYTAFEQPNQRAYCQALEQHKIGQCYAIQDVELCGLLGQLGILRI